MASSHEMHSRIKFFFAGPRVQFFSLWSVTDEQHMHVSVRWEQILHRLQQYERTFLLIEATHEEHRAAPLRDSEQSQIGGHGLSELRCIDAVRNHVDLRGRKPAFSCGEGSNVST